MTHKHRTKEKRGPAPFSGPVSNKPIPRAHGNTKWLHVCRCGAQKYVNCNNFVSEHGPWVGGEA